MYDDCRRVLLSQAYGHLGGEEGGLERGSGLDEGEGVSGELDLLLRGADLLDGLDALGGLGVYR